MTNDMNAFELSDEQLEEVNGAGSINVSPQVALNINVQNNIAVAPTIGVAVGSGLNLKGANLNLGNLGKLDSANNQ